MRSKTTRIAGLTLTLALAGSGVARADHSRTSAAEFRAQEESERANRAEERVRRLQEKLQQVLARAEAAERRADEAEHRVVTLKSLLHHQRQDDHPELGWRQRANGSPGAR